MASCRIQKVRTIGRSFLLHYFIVSSFWLAWSTFSLSLSNLRGWFYRPSFQLAAPLETLARAAAELQLRKRTHIGNYHSVSTFSCHLACFWLSSFASTCSILLPLFQKMYIFYFLVENVFTYYVSGMDFQFEWEEVEAFVRQPDGSLFSWCERFRCYHHLIYEIVSHCIYINLLILSWSFLTALIYRFFPL